MENLGVGKQCRWCGARANTLGGVCPACGKPYVPGGLLDRMPFLGSDSLRGYRGSLALIVCASLLAGWIWLTITQPVAGIAIAGFAFVALVAAIGIANLLDQPRR